MGYIFIIVGTVLLFIVVLDIFWGYLLKRINIIIKKMKKSITIIDLIMFSAIIIVLSSITVKYIKNFNKLQESKIETFFNYKR